MEHWNPFGWLLLGGGFLYGVVISWMGMGIGGWPWMIGYAATLAGLTILTTNMVRAIWRYGRKRKSNLNHLSS